MGNVFAAAFDCVEARAVYGLGLIMRVGKVGSLSETVIVEAYNPLPMAVRQQSGHFFAVTLGHHYYYIGAIEQFRSHGHGISSHVIPVFGRNLSHYSLAFKALGYPGSTRTYLDVAGAIEK